MTTSEYCGACGASLSGAGSFCSACGAPIDHESPQPVSRHAAPLAAGFAPTAVQTVRESGSSALAPTTPPPPTDEPPSRSPSAIVGVTQRYASLRTIAGIFTVLAWLVIVLDGIGVVVAVGRMEEPGSESPQIWVIVVGALYLALLALYLFAAAAFIRLMINVEENTRRTAELLAEGVGD
jgi:hypothetical protein